MNKIQIQLRALVRFFIFIVLAIAYFGVSFWIHWTTRNEIQRRKRFSENGCRFCFIACKLFNIQVTARNKLSKKEVGLIVGNHLGFVDILAACSLMPSLFVTSKEMHETPLLGLITEFAGCVYVERRQKTNIKRELQDMVDYLMNGFRVVLYPEATSHNGEHVLPFKRTLITSAAYAGVPIYPYVFNFKSINGEPFSMKYRDHVCYYGEIPFYISIWRLLTLKSVICEIEFLDPIFTTPDDNRAVVADRLHKIISDKFIPVEK